MIKLDYESLKTIDVAEYKKLFKDKKQWKRATAAFFIKDFNFGGKKLMAVALIRKASELKKLFKTIKADKNPGAKIAGGLIQFKKGPNGPQLEFEPTLGSMNSEQLKLKANKLFKALLKTELVITDGTTSTTTKEQGKENDTQESQEQDNSQELLELVKTISTTFKEEIKARILPNINEQSVEENDKKVITGLIEIIEEFQEGFNQANTAVQSKLQKQADKIETLLPKIQKIQTLVH